MLASMSGIDRRADTPLVDWSDLAVSEMTAADARLDHAAAGATAAHDGVRPVEQGEGIATFAGFVGFWVENFEPIAWAEELIEPACTVDHRRLAFLYVIASQCYTSGRVDAAVRYCDAGMSVIESGRGEVPFGIDGMLFAPYVYVGQPEQAAEWCRSRVQSGRDTHTTSRIGLVICLAVAQSHAEAIDATEGLDRGRGGHPQSVGALIRANRHRHRPHTC